MTSKHTRMRGRGGARGAWVGAAAEEGRDRQRDEEGEGGASGTGTERRGLGVCSAAGGPPVQRPAASTSSSPCRPSVRRRRPRRAAPRSGRGSLAAGLPPQDPPADRPCRGLQASSSSSPSTRSARRWRLLELGRFSLRAVRHGRAAAPTARMLPHAVAAGADERGGGRGRWRRSRGGDLGGKKKREEMVRKRGECDSNRKRAATERRNRTRAGFNATQCKHGSLDGVEAFQASIWTIDFHRGSFLGDEFVGAQEPSSSAGAKILVDRAKFNRCFRGLIFLI
jgi:hypothetical protein